MHIAAVYGCVRVSTTKKNIHRLGIRGVRVLQPAKQSRIERLATSGALKAPNRFASSCYHKPGRGPLCRARPLCKKTLTIDVSNNRNLFLHTKSVENV